MSNATPFCPVCGEPLVLHRDGAFNPWVCTKGHGLAATTSELYEKAQEDELDQLWKLAKQATAGTRACPMCEQPMAVVDLAWDADEAVEGAPGDGPDEGHEQLDVCVRDEVVWFDATEMEALPGDLPDAMPSADDLAKVDQIAEQFATEVDAAGRAEDDHSVTGRISNLVLRHSRAARFMADSRKARVDRQVAAADQSV